MSAARVTRNHKGRAVIQGGCPCGWWAFSNCQRVQHTGDCRAPLAERPVPTDKGSQ